MKRIKRVIALLTGCLMLGGYSADLQAMDNRTQEVTDGMIVYSSDVIVTKTRVYNGKLQYRRWNETKNCWVDPYWIDMP